MNKVSVKYWISVSVLKAEVMLICQSAAKIIKAPYYESCLLTEGNGNHQCDYKLYLFT